MKYYKRSLYVSVFLVDPLWVLFSKYQVNISQTEQNIRFDKMKHLRFTCDAIKGNQLELEHVTFSIFYFIQVLIWRSTFCWQPTWIDPVVPKLWAIEGFSEQQKAIEINSFFWLYSISQSMLPTSDWFCARSQHICVALIVFHTYSFTLAWVD